jgi:phenylacetate-CoA ligase
MVSAMSSSTTARAYWKPEEETLARPALEALQLERLKRTVARVCESVPLYRKKFEQAKVTPGDIRTLADLRRLPFTTGADLRESYPAGMLAVPLDETLRLHTSSGTTGKPKALFFSRQDVDNAAELIARSFVAAGMTKRDIFQNMMTYGLFTGALVAHYGAEKIGCLVIPAGPGTSRRVSRSILPMSWKSGASIRARICRSSEPSLAPSPTARKPGARSKTALACACSTPTDCPK